jgi:hypothetical protein
MTSLICPLFPFSLTAELCVESEGAERKISDPEEREREREREKWKRRRMMFFFFCRCQKTMELVNRFLRS